MLKYRGLRQAAYHSYAGVEHALSLAATLLLTASLAFAQDPGKERLCDAASATTMDHDAGVIIQKVMLSGKWGRNEAMFYLPDKEIADGAVLFSHSAIHADTGASVDLLPFALTLAHAGAAVIVPERFLIWPPTFGVGIGEIGGGDNTQDVLSDGLAERCGQTASTNFNGAILCLTHTL
ncbi:MAG: hypothetical protein WA830_08310 [Candidatus Sulfotelmatobacter sp.]